MLDVLRALEVDPFADRVVVERTRVAELACLDVDRDAREEAVAAAVVVVQVGIDDAGDERSSRRLVPVFTQVLKRGPRFGGALLVV